MGLALEGVDWKSIRTEYQSGRTITELSQTHGIKPVTLYKRRTVEGWDINKELVKKIVARSVEETVSELSPKIDEAKLWIQDTISEGKNYRYRIRQSLDEAGSGPVDSDHLDKLTRASQRVDDVTRRSLGLIDKPETSVTVQNSISLENYQSNLALIDRLSISGKLNSKMIDMESLEQASLELATKQGFMPVRSTDQAMQDLYAASALAKQQEQDKQLEPAKPVDPEEAGSL